jgi:putative Mg2+ transporter-C (MgtC) family protein
LLVGIEPGIGEAGSEAPDVESLAFAADMGVALALGLIIGIERELRHHEAGLRTNALVALGAALFVSLPRFIDHDGSPTRVAGQVVTGIGFLAGGVIIRDGFSVRGLTTAGTLWCTAAIGALAGSGFTIAAAVGTGWVILSHLALRPFTTWLNENAKRFSHVETGYRIRAICGAAEEPTVRAKILAAVKSEKHMSLLSLHGLPAPQPAERLVMAELTSNLSADEFVERVAAELGTMNGVSSTGWDRTTGRPVT